MKIHILGSGTPTPSLDRMGSGYLIRIDDDFILLDCGPGTYHRLLQLDVDITRVSHVFLSHLHYDHCLDYVRLFITRWDLGAGLIPELNVYGPPPLKQMNDRLFSVNGAFAPDIEARTKHEGSVGVFMARGGTPPRKWPDPDIRELTEQDEIRGDSWVMKPFEVRHMQPYLTCYGYKLVTDDGVLIYSGDTRPCKKLEEMAADCDVLIHMCQFISGTVKESSTTASTGHRELAKLAERAKVKNLVVSHINRQMDVPGIRERIIAEMSDIYKGTIFWGADLMEIPMKTPSPNAYA
jgi:ribonuclease Z